MLANDLASSAIAAAPGTDRSAPLGIGKPGKIGDYSVTVLDVTPNANEIIAAENQFNDPPKDGNQYLIARVAVLYSGNESGKPAFELSFKVVGDRGVAYTTFDDSCGVVPEGLNDAPELFEGGEVELNLCWSVSSAEIDSLMMYVEPLLNMDDERVWFSLGGNGGATGTPTADSSARTVVKESSRKRPIPVGSIGLVGDYEVSVDNVTPNADDIIAAENQFNDPPAAGNQFFMARIEMTYTGSETGSPAFDLNFQSVGALNKGYSTFDNDCGVTPDSAVNLSDVFPGGKVTFNVCWQIATEDADSLVMYVEPLFSFDNERTWFSLDSSGSGEEPSKDAKATEVETSLQPAAIDAEISTKDIAFAPKELTIAADTDVTITITNEGVLQHDFVIDSGAIESILLNGGDSDTVVVNLPAGTYQFYCSVPGHREAGMVGTLIVE
ncbi:MAG TPA: cupredoxin domain-containing protein [Thermomicrobiales bacterium]|nr:cupredoxin domain-containing protein [Thermomicrobiales bacterium]